MRAYRITPSAEQDLREIARYTAVTWGKNQALQYAERLQQRFDEIAAKTVLSRSFSMQYPEILVNRCEQHFIFFIHSEDEIPCIIAVLHKRMDLVAWLQQRLQT